MTRKTLFRELVKQLFSFILPFIVIVLIPFLIQYGFKIPPIRNRNQGVWPFMLFVAGLALMIAGLSGIAWTVSLFVRIGKGTLAPWSPTKRLVVIRPYAHVRNPMIMSVIAVLLGEALFFGSWPILVWAIAVFALNHFYFIISEEPGLIRRFGAEYETYKRNVPRWLPRLRPWKPDEKSSARQV
jgi:protein-S-isoprenylcysteine O-methyltransferase Ste14